MASSSILLVFTCMCILGSKAIFMNIANKRETTIVCWFPGMVGSISENHSFQLMRMKMCPSMAWDSGRN